MAIDRIPAASGGGGGGSGTVTSIAAGTGIVCTPDPITTTGVVSTDGFVPGGGPAPLGWPFAFQGFRRNKKPVRQGPTDATGLISHYGLSNEPTTMSGAGYVAYLTLLSTNIRTSWSAMRGVSGNNSQVGSRTIVNTSAFYWRGNAAGLGGFYWFARVAIWQIRNSVPLQGLSLFGLAPALLPLNHSANMSAEINCCFFGSDKTDTNLQFMHNDGSGTCTKVDLGADFNLVNSEGVTGSTWIFDLEMYCPGGGGDIQYRATRVDDPTKVASGTATTNLPTNTVFMLDQLLTITGNTGGAGNLTVGHEWSDVVAITPM